MSSPDADTVCLVYIKINIGIFVFQFHECLERSYISVHAEDAFRHNDDPAVIFVIFLDQRFQNAVIVMTVADAVSTG